MRRIVWKFGLVSGGILAGFLILTTPFEKTIGLDRAEWIGYATMVAGMLIVYFGVRSYRDEIAGGVVSFARALAVGGLIAVISASCYTIAWEVIYFGVRPDFTGAYTTYQLDRARASGATQAQLDAKAAELRRFAKMYENPLSNAAITFVEPLPVALLVTLVSAATLSRKRRHVDATAPATA
jgi:Protein of unknown function (DUF4199)